MKKNIDFKNKIVFSGFQLKLIAMISMFIDHMAAGLLENYVFNANAQTNFTALYSFLRNIGRLAFPIYAFLLVEGFFRTKNIKLYLSRLLFFAFISQAPFSLLNTGKPFDFSYTNTLFTLFLGLLAIYIIDKSPFQKNSIKDVSFMLFIIVIFSFIAIFINSDYSYHGVIAIALIYLFFKSGSGLMFAMFLGFLFEFRMPAVFLSLPIIHFYNGERGTNLKYFFYIFYPAHLLLIYFMKSSIIKI